MCVTRKQSAFLKQITFLKNIPVLGILFHQITMHLKMTDFSFFVFQLDVFFANAAGDLSNYQENGEFKLESVKPQKHCVFYSCCPSPFPDVTYKIKLRRRPMFYVFNLILPCVLINGIGKKLLFIVLKFPAKKIYDQLLFIFFLSIVGVLCSFGVGRKSNFGNFGTFINDGLSDDYKREPATDRKNALNK